ncbi:MAG: DMP19 family protein [Planctomycetales bacterium]|nr:DMP19 family protein [Planctomycetales bacterium]
MTETEFLIKLSESTKTDFGKRPFTEQSGTQRIFTAVFGSAGAIMMDGIIGYFTNYDGESVPGVVEAYKSIGSPKRAEILERACRILSRSALPESGQERRRLVDALSKKSRRTLESLTQEFYDVTDDVDSLLLGFVRTHPEAFGPVPKQVR